MFYSRCVENYYAKNVLRNLLIRVIWTWININLRLIKNQYEKKNYEYRNKKYKYHFVIVEQEYLYKWTFSILWSY